jgi:putative ABC transport system permease protein
VFFTYLRRELGGRKRQTIIVAAGMALAIALVIVVSAVSTGVKDAQAATLASVYGVGTDITVTQEPTATANGGTGGPQQFQFGAGDGQADGNGQRQLAQNMLRTSRGETAYADTALATVQKTAGVAAATGTLALQNTSFSGQIPDFSQRQQGEGRQSGGTGSTQNGPSNFSVDSFTVTGIDPAATKVGPMTSAKVVSGRMLTAADAGKDDVVLDKTYATAQSLTVGGTMTIGGTTFTIVGIVESTSSDSSTAADSYIPLDVAQALSSDTGKLTTIYVSAASASDVSSIQTALKKSLPDNTVSTQADLASNVSGSLSTASTLITGLGTWLSIIVLLAAFLIAILFTISGVGRRTREFGTLKALGWRNGRIVRQVAGESLVQGVLGGVIGVVVGLVGILVINLAGPTLTSSTSPIGRFAGFGGGNGAFGGGAGGTGTGTGGSGEATGEGGFGGVRQAARAAASATDVVLHAPVTVEIIVIAVILAVVGGLLAGAFGGWRASRLRPAEALRSVA